MKFNTIVSYIAMFFFLAIIVSGIATLWNTDVSGWLKILGTATIMFLASLAVAVLFEVNDNN